MTNTPKISIIIPVYNGANYLKEAIDSALGQTSNQAEVIVVNDGSNDEGQTEAIAKSYGDKIRYLYKENGGVASALNLGIRNMSGEWFAWLSHDDIFASNRVAEDLTIIDKNPEVKVVYCGMKIINSAGEVIRDANYPIQQITDLLKVLTFLHMCTMTIHKSCFEKIGLFDESKKTTQDVDLCIRLTRISSFYLNSNSVTYTREHLNSGRYACSGIYKKELLDFCDLIHNEFSFKDLFPDLKTDKEVSNSWFYLGDLYRSLGATHYHDECYQLGIMSDKEVFSRLIKMLNFKLRKLNNLSINKFLNLLYKIFQ